MKMTVFKVMVTVLFTLHFSLFTATAQTAKSVLDKAAQTITVKEGVKANFKMTGSHGHTSGTILIKGKKFHATTTVATIWFDGKTQWTYMKNNDEVNISTPTEAQLQAINPYNFINLYKNGYASTLNKSGKDFIVQPETLGILLLVHLVAGFGGMSYVVLNGMDFSCFLIQTCV